MLIASSVPALSPTCAVDSGTMADNASEVVNCAYSRVNAEVGTPGWVCHHISC